MRWVLTTCWLSALGSSAVVCAWWTARHRSEWRFVAVGLAGVAAAIAWALRGPLVPTDWITVLQEGTTASNVRQLYGRGAHAGRGFDALLVLWSASGPVDLSAVVRLNVFLAAVNASFYWVIARRILGSIAGACFLTAVFAANPNSLNSALSELPSQALTACILAAVPALALLHDERDRSRRLVAVSVVHLGVLVVLVGALRVEMALVGILAFAVTTVRVALGDARLRAIAAAGIERITQSVRSLDRRVLLLVGAVFAASLLWSPHNAELRWVYDGFHPLNPSFLTFGLVLTSFLPFGVVAMIVLGVIHASRELLRFALLPVALVVLCRTYVSAAHGSLSVFWETFRYSTMLMPLLLVLAAFGWPELREMATRRSWPPAWRPVAIATLALAMLVPPPPGTRDRFFPGGDPTSALVKVPGLVTRDTQIEVRYLLRLVDEHPGCAFFTRVTARDHGSDRSRGPFVFVGFGRPLRSPRELGDSAEEALQALCDHACVLFYRGLDCNLAGDDGCPLPSPAVPVSALEFGALPYNDVAERGESSATVHLGAYAVRL